VISLCGDAKFASDAEEESRQFYRFNLDVAMKPETDDPQV